MKKEDFFTGLARSLELTGADLNESSKLGDFLDSFSTLSLLMYLDEHFTVTLEPESIVRMNTLGDLMDYIGQENFE